MARERTFKRGAIRFFSIPPHRVRLGSSSLDARIDKDNYCPECEYDNTDAISVCCWECGQRYPDDEWLDHNGTCDECVMYLEDIARQEGEEND
jgi:hypothetical protein